MRNIFLFLALLFVSVIISGCGSNDDNTVARVVDLFLDDRTISSGEETVLRTQFVFSDDRVFADDDDIYIVIQVPAEFRFRNNSAEIQNDFGDEDVSPTITTCGEGQESYLRFKLDDEDLESADDPSGAADAELALTLDAIASADLAIIRAAAGNDEIPFGCGQPFLSDRETSLIIS